ncbi:DUF4401 domain-containing protein [Pontibacter sp. MBLB2868]|uniref:DUF4401 domain-containing protein n=1 Tax=Pontibacter sp. MBLB2868 TaxID=3451555 RepID=UPI003F74EC46
MESTKAQQIEALLHDIEREQDGFIYDRAGIDQEVARDNGAVVKKLPIKVLTILGGLLGTSTFVGFFLSAGLYESGLGLLLFGLGFLVGAELLIRYKEDATTDSVGVALYITGYVLLAIGTGQLSDSGSIVALVLACASTLALLLSRSAISVFMAVLVLNGSLLGLIFLQKLYDLSHVLLVVLGTTLTYMSLNESKLVASSSKLNLKYGSLRMGVIFSLVATLGLLVHQKFLSTSIEHYWVSSLALSVCLLLLVYKVLQDAAPANSKMQLLVLVSCCIVLAPTIFTPSVPGALLVLLSSFYIGHKTGFWVGLVALAYFIFMYYYDLHMTLLAKSAVLVASGLLFLLCFWVVNKLIRSYAD